MTSFSSVCPFFCLRWNRCRYQKKFYRYGRYVSVACQCLNHCEGSSSQFNDAICPFLSLSAFFFVCLMEYLDWCQCKRMLALITCPYYLNFLFLSVVMRSSNRPASSFLHWVIFISNALIGFSNVSINVNIITTFVSSISRHWNFLRITCQTYFPTLAKMFTRWLNEKCLPSL